MKKYLKYIPILTLFLLATYTEASSIEVVVDTARENVNAIEGMLNLPSGISVESFNTGNSAIIIWIQEPHFDAASNVITFSGIAPGGFQGKRPIFSFTTNSDALFEPSFTQIRALRNDGAGTEARVSLSLRETQIKEDLDPPEPFKPIISRSSEAFDNQKFVTFVAQDKGLGIDHYEYALTWFLSPDDSAWQKTSSPILLTNKMLLQKIYIKAVDRAGNERVAVSASNYHYALVFVGTIIMLLCALFLRRLYSRSES